MNEWMNGWIGVLKVSFLLRWEVHFSAIIRSNIVKCLDGCFFPAFESLESINSSLWLLLLIAPWEERNSFTPRISSFETTALTFAHIKMCQKKGFLQRARNRRWTCVIVNIKHFITSNLHELLSYILKWKISARRSSAVISQQGGIMLLFDSHPLLTPSVLHPIPDSLSTAPPLTWKANWALENIYERGRAIGLRSFNKGGREVRRDGGGERKERNCEKDMEKADTGRQRQRLILIFPFNLLLTW